MLSPQEEQESFVSGPQSVTFELTVLREEDAVAAKNEFREHVINGLSAREKSISSKYFYDDIGSGEFSGRSRLSGSFPDCKRVRRSNF